MIRIYETPDELSQHLARFVVDTAIKAVKERGRFSFCLTGGSSPKELYTLLASAPFKDEMPWAETFVFWGDERCVADTDPQNNALMAFNLLLDHVPVPAAQIFRMNGAMDPEQAAAAYEEQLKAFFKGMEPQLDLILLGMGDNAHTASLFPHTSVLEEQHAWVKGLFIEEVNMSRITLTAPFINLAREIVFILFGASKASTLHEVLEGEINTDLKPVQLIEPDFGEVTWFIDKAAAAMLTVGY